MTSWTQIEDEAKVAEILGRLEQSERFDVYRHPELYELAYPGYTGDAAFYLSRTRCGRVLYLGVGTGRIFLPMARRNRNVFGVEQSSEMCELLARRDPDVAKRVFQCSALRAEVTPASYDVVVAPYSFLQVIGRDRLEPLLFAVHDCLKPQGVFLTDTFSPYSIPFSLSGLEANVRHFHGESKIAIYVTYNHLEQKMQELAAIEQSGCPPRVLEMHLDYYFPCELSAAMLSAGFASVRVTGDYRDAPFDPGANRVLVYEAARF